VHHDALLYIVQILYH